MSHVRGHIDGVNDEAYGVAPTTTTLPPPPPASNQSFLDPAAQAAFAQGLAYGGTLGQESFLRPVGVAGRTYIDPITGQPGFAQGLFYEGMQSELLFGTTSPEILGYDELLVEMRDAAVSGGFLKKSDLPPIGETNDKFNAFIDQVFARANENTPTKPEQEQIKTQSMLSDPRAQQFFLYRKLLSDATADILDKPPTIEVTPYIAPDPVSMKQSVKAYMRQRLGREASENEMRNLAALLANEYKLQYQNQIANEIANTQLIPINNVSNVDMDEAMTQYDPQANFVEQFENMYENDINFVERKAAERASFAQFRKSISAGEDFMSG